MSRAGRVPGRGAAVARQMGLLPGPGAGGSPGDADGDGDAALEAELLLLLGGREAPERGAAPQPAPRDLAAVEALAQLCLRDPPEEEEEEGEEDLENEEELLAELQEVLEEGSGSPADAETPQDPAPAGALLAELEERAQLYRAALGNNGSSSGSSGARLRRLQRGLKTLEQMLESVRSGKPIDRAEIPPPVALGKAAGTPGLPPPVSPEPPAQPPAPAQPPPAPVPCPDPCPDPGSVPALRLRLQELQKEALVAKRHGDNATALEHFRAAKRLEAQLEALGQGRAPPAPDPQPEEPRDPPARDTPARDPPARGPPATSPEPPRAPRDVREALEQRMERYRAAAGQAKDSGDARKARMHERIVKQYQAALRAHSAGKAVDLSELPVPPGFPPIQGTETPAEPSISGMLEAASRLAVPEQEEEEEEEEEKEDTKVQPSAPPVPPPKQPARNSQAAPKPAGKAQQQLEFLELRRRQLAQAALRAKRRNDLEGAKLLLRRAKGVEGLLGAARGGLPVDIAQVPEVPLDGAEFELGPAHGVPMAPEVAKTFLQLAGALRRQHQMCLTYSRQFAHLGNISETTRCEALAEECRRHMETLRREHGRGGPPPRPRYEQRTFSIVKMFPELSSSDLELGIERGIGLPVPPGVAPGDLDTFVRFEFPHPSVEEAQRDKTNVVKGTDCPEFRARFRLRLLRGHRGLRRLLSSRGIRLEVTHKGGLFRPERALGSAQLRLEGLEGSCELREQLELLDGRRRTGGRLEVWVRIREPLGAQRQLEPRSERWLVLEPAPEPTGRWGFSRELPWDRPGTAGIGREPTGIGREPSGSAGSPPGSAGNSPWDRWGTTGISRELPRDQWGTTGISRELPRDRWGTTGISRELPRDQWGTTGISRELPRDRWGTTGISRESPGIGRELLELAGKPPGSVGNCWNWPGIPRDRSGTAGIGRESPGIGRELLELAGKPPGSVGNCWNWPGIPRDRSGTAGIGRESPGIGRELLELAGKPPGSAGSRRDPAGSPRADQPAVTPSSSRSARRSQTERGGPEGREQQSPPDAAEPQPAALRPGAPGAEDGAARPRRAPGAPRAAAAAPGPAAAHPGAAGAAAGRGPPLPHGVRGAPGAAPAALHGSGAAPRDPGGAGGSQGGSVQTEPGGERAPKAPWMSPPPRSRWGFGEAQRPSPFWGGSGGILPPPPHAHCDNHRDQSCYTPPPGVTTTPPQ